MNKIILICLLFVIPTALTQDCANPVLTALAITPKLSSPAAQTGLEYCKGLEGKDLCCSSTVINNLQTTIDALVLDLIEEAALRDANYLVLQTSTTAGIPSITTGLSTLQTKGKAAYDAAKAADTASSTSDSQALVAKLLSYSTISTTTNAALSTAVSDWDKYQAARVTCMNALVEAEASVYCFACTSAYATTGISTANSVSTLSFATAFQTSIQAACYSYIAYAQEQDALVLAYALSGKYTNLNTLFDAIAAGTGNHVAADVTAIEDAVTYSTKSYAAPITSTGDAACTSATACDVAYTGFFSALGVLNKANAAAGGEIVTSSSRLLAGSRMLSGSYDASSDANSAGVTVSFPEDPIAYLSAWRQGGLMTCVVALVAMLLF